MTSPYTCRYCRLPSDASGIACPNCGAPVDVKAVVSQSGWLKQPPIADMARIQFGQSRVQIEGSQVPVADFALGGQDWIYFSHHMLLWADSGAHLQAMKMKGGWNRMLAGIPLYMLQGGGPGHIALSDNHAGDMIALPLQHGQAMWVREHRLVAATGNIGFDYNQSDVWYTTQDGDEEEWHWPMGQFNDIFYAQQGPGLVLLHSPGNTFIRDLRPGETILLQGSAMLYRDPSVTVHLHTEYPHSPGLTGWRRSWEHRTIWVRAVGPGRVAVQSIFERPEGSDSIKRASYRTVARW
jgi:uncharacterized protein (AIM24 family)